MQNVMRSVDHIDNPHLTQEFIWDLEPVNLVNIMQDLRTSAQLWLDNRVCEAMQQAVDQFRNVTEIIGSEVEGLDVSGKLVVCDPMNHVRLAGKMAYVLPSHNTRMDDRILVVTKRDNTHLLDYHLEAFQPEPNKVGMRLKVQFHLGDCTSGVQYIVNNGYDECLR